MKFQYRYGSTCSSQEIQQLNKVLCQCFGSSLADGENYLKRIGAENFRFLTYQDRVIAGLAIYPMGQWFGGNNIPMAGIAAVGVTPEFRGQGAASELLSQTLQELYHLKIPISTLYPATQVLYRQLGYEQAGSYCKWELPTASIQLRERNVSMQPVNISDRNIFEQIYNQQAQVNNGNLARHPAIWQQILTTSESELIYAYTIGEANQPEGYIIFIQDNEEIIIRDWAILTISAAKRLWTFLADHRSIVEKVIWRGSPFNPWTMLLPEQTAKMTKETKWMLRIVNVPLALSQRGYPPNLKAELHLDIKDDLLSANNGKFKLEISAGKGEVTSEGKGDFQIDIRGLAALYTGFISPQKLQSLGKINTTSESLNTASLIFAGDRPTLAEFF